MESNEIRIIDGARKVNVSLITLMKDLALLYPTQKISKYSKITIEQYNTIEARIAESVKEADAKPPFNPNVNRPLSRKEKKKIIKDRLNRKTDSTSKTDSPFDRLRIFSSKIMGKGLFISNVPKKTKKKKKPKKD